MKQSGMFWPFRLLIATLFTLVVFMMIQSAIVYFYDLRVQASMVRMEKGFLSAANAPTTYNPGDPTKGIVREKDLTIPDTTITTRPFADSLNTDRECITFQSSRANIEIAPGKRSAVVRQEQVLNVFFACYIGLEADCPQTCIISFGVEPEPGEI